MVTGNSADSRHAAQDYLARPVQAIRFSIENHQEILDLCPGAAKDSRVSLFIPSGNSYAHMIVGDWLVKDGNTYKVLSNREFRRTYYPAGDAQ